MCVFCLKRLLQKLISYRYKIKRWIYPLINISCKARIITKVWNNNTSLQFSAFFSKTWIQIICCSPNLVCWQHKWQADYRSMYWFYVNGICREYIKIDHSIGYYIEGQEGLVGIKPIFHAWKWWERPRIWTNL